MAEYYKGTLLASPIVRGSSGDTYGTHHSVLGVGGYMEFKTLAERDALPPTFELAVNQLNLPLNYDDISIGQRRFGMLVHVLETNEYYHLHPQTSGGTFITLAEWNGYTYYQKVSGLTNNANWHIVPIGDNDDIGERISKEFYQNTNGFDLGDVIGHDGNDFIRVNSATAALIEPLGVVTVTGDTFILTFAGHVNTNGMVDYSGNSLSASTVYYLSPNFVGTGYTSFDGKLSHIPPTNLTDVSKPMLVTTETGKGVVLQYRGRSRTEEGVSLGDFLAYSASTQIHLDAAVTGATNIGFFSGKTGIQRLNIQTLGTVPNTYNSDTLHTYNSLYNYYYIDNTGIIRIGSPTYHGVLRRGYVRQPIPISSPVHKSWVWNEYTGDTFSQVGWIFLDGDISNFVGETSIGFTQRYYGTGYTGNSYTETEWITGSVYNNLSYTTVNDVYGNLNTGNTYVFGGPVYSDKQYKELRLRTIISNTPETLTVTFDDNFIYLSGITSTLNVTGATGGRNIGTGQHVFSGMTGNTLAFRTLVGSGSTIVSTVGNNIIIYSSGGTGDVGGTYNLSSPSVIPLGGICSGTVLTGKTSFQLFEELLVPELCGTITPPSISNGLSVSGLCEIGCIVSETVTGTFSRGSISPQYCSVSPFRSGCVNAYCFTGTGMPSGFQATTSSPYFINNPSYTVLIGTQSWGVCAKYDAGFPALGSKGTQYSAALSSGITSAASDSIIGAYPLFATTVNITTLTKQTLQNMSTANNIQINLVADSSPNKQKFEIPCAWLGAPINRPLVGVCQWNTVSSQWEYPGGSTGTSLTIWTASPTSETVQGNVIGYCQYTYNSTDRSAVCIRLVF